MTDSQFQIRVATPADAALVTAHRVAMFKEIKRTPIVAEQPFINALLVYFRRAIAEGVYKNWFVTHASGEVVAGGGLLLRELVPRPDAMEGKEAIILNIYVEPPYRRQGLARLLMETLLAWTAQHGIARVVLHPSEQGKALYASLGFVDTFEMIYRPAKL